MPRKEYRESFSCRRCRNLASRVFGIFLPEKMPDENDRYSVRPEILPYMILDWWCCANEKCRNWFNRWPNLSRCPVCHHWSVSFSIRLEDKHWRCLKKKDCGWSFSILVSPRKISQSEKKK